jgi:hypothetical protein
MRLLKFLPLALLMSLGACATPTDAQAARCQVHEIADIVNRPVENADKVFCGNAYAVEYGRGARILENAQDMPPSMDLAMVVTTRTTPLLDSLSDLPQEYYIEARIDPMLECFDPSASDEGCSPYRRPVTMHILAARKLQ